MSVSKCVMVGLDKTVERKIEAAYNRQLTEYAEKFKKLSEGKKRSIMAAAAEQGTGGSDFESVESSSMEMLRDMLGRQ